MVVNLVRNAPRNAAADAQKESPDARRAYRRPKQIPHMLSAAARKSPFTCKLSSWNDTAAWASTHSGNARDHSTPSSCSVKHKAMSKSASEATVRINPAATGSSDRRMREPCSTKNMGM